MSKQNKSKTGSVRKNVGKPQVSQVDPEFILGIADILTASMEKYEKFNWKKGIDYSVPYDSCQRHLLKFMKGENYDDESGKHHLLHAAVNLMFLYYYSQNLEEFDDRVFHDS